MGINTGQIALSAVVEQLHELTELPIKYLEKRITTLAVNGFQDHYNPDTGQVTTTGAELIKDKILQDQADGTATAHIQQMQVDGELDDQAAETAEQDPTTESETEEPAAAATSSPEE
jgi:hypothetical protein